MTCGKTINDIVKSMQQLVVPGSPEPQDPIVLSQLRQLTQDLVEAYKSSGRLQGDPFYDAWTRPVHLYEEDVKQQLQGKVVLVTGGEGFVGTCLIKKLVELGADRVISVDKARYSTAHAEAIRGIADNVLLYVADVRNYDDLKPIFETERPQLVFHLAAQRLPGLAEQQIRETVTSNIFGTQNVIHLCEEYGVEQCMFSSTGKASRYFTAEVYAASKKVACWLFQQATKRGRVRYGMVRFTHMLDNSSMCEQIDSKIQAGRPVNIHAPDRYVVGQNVGEAVNLLLNGLVLSELGILKFLLVRNLGWPTESLEVALYKILESGKDLPIYFQGIIPGYEESFFLGQVDWDDQLEINTLINALETSYRMGISSSNDMIIAEPFPFTEAVLVEQLPQLKRLCDDTDVSEADIKKKLADLVRAVSQTNFEHASAKRVLQILRWGVNPKQYEKGELNLAHYKDIIEILVRSLTHRLSQDVLNDCRMSWEDFSDLLNVLETLPSVAPEVIQMRQVLASWSVCKYIRQENPRELLRIGEPDAQDVA